MKEAVEKGRLAFVIHELNSWGGHDRSTLEIIRELSHRWPVEIYSYALSDPRGFARWGSYTHHPVRPYIRRPAIVLLVLFFFLTWPRIRLIPWLRRRFIPLVHSTGACTFGSDVIQVQFVQAAWHARQKTLRPHVYAPPFSRGRAKMGAWALGTYHRLLQAFNLLVERWIYSKDKTYIAISQSVADELKEHFGLIERVHVIHHGVDSQLFRIAGRAERHEIRSRLGLGEDEVAVAFVGAYERKGLSVAVDAISCLEPALRSRVKLVAIGDGAIGGFQERAERAGIGSRVVFLQHQKDIAPYYRACDLFLLPTLYEPFGMVILEAMASGLASVVSQLAGAAELIQDGVSGKLIQNPEDPREVSQLLAPLIEDRSLREKMGLEARRVAESRPWSTVAQEYAAVLTSLKRL